MKVKRRRDVSGGGRNEKKRFLVIVNVLGSTGPIRLVVKEDEAVAVAAVIESTLKTYAKESRLPALASDVTNFVLYSAGDQANSDSQALEAGEAIGRSGGRNFVLCKNQRRQPPQMTEGRPPAIMMNAAAPRKGFLRRLEGMVPQVFPCFIVLTT